MVTRWAPKNCWRQIMKGRATPPHLSFFAFTATPKSKTLEVFGKAP
jgi:hypothetical protein